MSENKKKNNNKRYRKSVTLSSNILLSLTKFNKDLLNQSLKQNNSNETLTPNKENSNQRKLKRRATINNTSSADRIKLDQKEQRRQSYSELFFLKLNYVSNDIGLSQKSEGSYSNLYKDGKRIFDDLEKSNSPKNSFSLSDSKTNLNDIQFKRRSSLQPNFFRNKNFNLLNFGDDSFESNKNDSSFISSNSSSEDIEKKVKKKIKQIENGKEKSKNYSIKISRKNWKHNSTKLNKKLIIKNLLAHGIIKEVEEEDEDGKGSNNIPSGNLNINTNNLKTVFYKKDILKEQLDKINNLDEEMKKQILRRHNSYENIKNHYNKNFILDSNDINRFFNRSKSLDVLMKNYNKKYNINNIEEIISKNKAFNLSNIKDISNGNIKNINSNSEDYRNFKLETKINQINNELIDSKSNINSPNEDTLKKIKFDSKIFNNENLSPLLKFNDELNSSEIKKKESFITRGAKISFLEIDENNGNAVNKFQKNIITDYNCIENKEKQDDTNNVIDNLLNQIREKSKEKENFLITIKEEKEKELLNLKEQKDELIKKKLKNIKNKKEKEKLSRQNRNKTNLKYDYNTISFETSVLPNYFENNNYSLTIEKINDNNLNLLSEPIITSKEKTLKNLKPMNTNKFLDYKKDTKIGNINKNTYNINNFYYLKNKNMNHMKNLNANKMLNNTKINSFYQNQKGKGYLQMLKHDISELHKKKYKIKQPLKINLFRRNIKDYIMPVNDMDDVIKINNIYKSLSPSLNINKEEKN